MFIPDSRVLASKWLLSKAIKSKETALKSLIKSRLLRLRLLVLCTQAKDRPCFKGQLISKQDCRGITSPKKTNVGFLPWMFTTSRLIQKESLSSFCKKIDSLLH